MLPEITLPAGTTEAAHNTPGDETWFATTPYDQTVTMLKAQLPIGQTIRGVPWCKGDGPTSPDINAWYWSTDTEALTVFAQRPGLIGPNQDIEFRWVAVTASLADELSALMVGEDRDALVFSDMRGGVLRNSNWRARVFGPAVAKCRTADDTFPTITPHDLRRTAASLAISAGANVRAVQRMLGHAKASMTLDVYADLFDTDLDAVAVELDAAIKAVAVLG